MAADIAGERLTGQQMADYFLRALGQPVRYNLAGPDQYCDLGFAGAEDLGNMFWFKRDFEACFYAVGDLGLSRSLNPAPKTFDHCLAANRPRIPIAGASP